VVTGAVILAAGASRRMNGRPKALLTVGGTTFLSLLTSTLRAAGADEVRAVVSAGLRPAAAALAVPGLELLVPPEPTAEPLVSLKAALTGPAHQWQALLVQPVDHPLVLPRTVRRLIDAYDGGRGRPLVQLRLRGRGGHPLLVGATLFDELLALPEGREGLRGLLREDPERVAVCETDDAGAVSGVNTEGDYRRLLGLEQRRLPISPPR